MMVVALILAIAVLGFAGSLYLSTPPQPKVGMWPGGEIANAIGTPPWPVPEWAAFIYPWQSLIGGCFALIAAALGGWALMRQTQKNYEGVLEQIQANQNLAESQAEKNKAAVMEQRSFRQRQVASAISGELRSILTYLRELQVLRSYETALETAKNRALTYMPTASIYTDTYPIFSAVCGEIGSFEGRVPQDIARVYGALQSFNDALKGIRAGEYSFLTDPLPQDSGGAVRMAELRSRRAEYGLQMIVDQLRIADSLGEQLLRDLDLISGRPMPPLPRQ